MSPSRQEEWNARLGSTYLDPLQVIDLQDAIRDRKKSVTVQGTKFLLTYTNSNTVYYQPADDRFFTPAGYLDIKRFLRD